MEDEVAETYLVQQALHQLSQTHRIWEKNMNTWYAQEPRSRILWWRRAKQQAELGAPAMQTLLLKVIELRLTK